MKKRIIYPMVNGTIAIISPGNIPDLTIEDIADKDVPIGVPYLIVPLEEIPDASTQGAWEADFSNPDGFGLGPDKWKAAEVATANLEP